MGWAATGSMEDEVTFLFQLGFTRDAVSAPQHLLTLAYLKELAVKFVHEKVLVYFPQSHNLPFLKCPLLARISSLTYHWLGSGRFLVGTISLQNVLFSTKMCLIIHGYKILLAGSFFGLGRKKILPAVKLGRVYRLIVLPRFVIVMSFCKKCSLSQWINGFFY